MSYRDEVRRALESTAARQTQNRYLSQIQDRHPALQRLNDVDELLDLLRDRRGDADQKDAALLALVTEHHRGRGGGAFALLAVAMFPALDRIYRTRLRGGEPDDLWGRVVGGFTEALDRYPVARRPTRVAANIECDVMKSLRRASLRERRGAVARDGLAAAVAPFLTDLEAVEPGAEDRERLSLGDFVRPGPEAAVPAGPAEIEAAREAVQPFFEASSVSAGDRFLILGVHLYQRTLGELAEELGISREAAKKRHLRAVTRLRVARSKAEEDDCDRTDVPSGQERDVSSQAGSCTRAGRVGAASGDDR